MAQQLDFLDTVTEDADFDTHLDSLVIRESGRARRLILRTRPPDKIELVVPPGTRARKIEKFVSEHARWIETAREEIRRRYTGEPERLPGSVDLRAIGRRFAVNYRYCANERAGIKAGPRADALEVVTADPRHTLAPAFLRRWLLGVGRRELKPWLERIAVDVGARPTSVQLRLQKTRWGSCSARGTISLNAASLFLEPELVRYLIIHELSHMKVMNHSRRFWAEVARHEPDCRALDRRLGDAWTSMPYWIMAQ